MSGKFALIIGNTEYSDPGLSQLTAPGKDAEDFARVLKDTEIGAFDDVVVLLNQPEYVVRESIDDFFNQKMPDDLLVLYFSGHGVRDELGALYLAVKNTVRSKLRATGIKSDYIREAMDQSRSRRQVLVLDCCNSGAFAQGTKAEIGGSVGTKSAFEGGYGRVILTASDSTQFAWEGDKVIGETDNSLFTHYLVEGLEGEADIDGDGRITVDELYDYTFAKVKFATPKQTPSKFATKQQGEIVLRQSMRAENIKPIALPGELLDEIEDTRPYVREAAVQKLERVLRGRNIGLAHSAREALAKIATDDDSRKVSQAALQVLESHKLIEEKAEAERKAREEAERLAALKAEEERLMREKVEAERKAKEETEKLLRAQAEREAAEQEAARLKAEREATEKAARVATEKAEREKKEKEIAEREAAHKAEQDAIKLASQKKAEREAAEKAERDAVQLAARKKAEREAKEGIGVTERKTTRPSWVTIAAIGGVVIGLILCGYGAVRFLPGIIGGAAPEADAPINNTSPSSATAITSSGPYECTDALGCVTIAPNDPIHIAWIQSVSGAIAFLGQTNLNGAQVAIDDVGGELLGHQIQFDGEDSLCNSEGGQAAGEKISADSTIVAILGTSCSSDTRGAMPTISEAGMIMVASSNTNPDLTNPSDPDHWPGYLRTSHNDLLQGRIAAQFAYNELGLRTAATVYDSSLYAQSLQQAFADVFTELGGVIIAQEVINFGDTNFTSVLTEISATSPDVIYFPIFEPEGNNFAEQKCNISGLDSTNLMSADGLFTSGFPQSTGPCAANMYITSAYVRSSSVVSFNSQYITAFGEAPLTPYAAHSYDAMNMIFAAIEQVAHVDADGTVHIPRQALRDALYNTRNFPGLTGSLTCNKNGDCATGEALGIFQITQSMINGTEDLVTSIPIWQP